MAISFENILNSWLGSLGKMDKRELDGIHLGVLISFRFMKLDLHFILAALEAWDQIHHVFHFGNNEVCPLPKDFGAILGWPLMMEPCMPSVEEHFFLAFERYLGLKPPLLSAIVYGRGVDLSLLVIYFAGLDVPKVFRLRALSFCIFARFLFSKQGFGNGNPSLIEIVEQFASGRNPIPLVIGETLIRLDMLKSDPSSLPSGSLILLQEHPKPVALNANRLEVWRRYWVAKPFLNIQFPPEPATLSAGYIVWMKGPSQREISLSGPAGVRGSRARRPASIDYEEGDMSMARPVLDRSGSKGAIRTVAPFAPSFLAAPLNRRRLWSTSPATPLLVFTGDVDASSHLQNIKNGSFSALQVSKYGVYLNTTCSQFPIPNSQVFASPRTLAAAKPGITMATDLNSQFLD
ncbi:hypothetical protein SOVF_011070 [Spinacia oleracea]|nr:hypothetical protein SOVF_011070 [Spinacia oleracea]